MSEDVLEILIRNQIQARADGQSEVQFVWQGGEPTLMGIPFFKSSCLAAQIRTENVVISNAFQTNGVLVSDEFAHFFHDQRFLLGEYR